MIGPPFGILLNPGTGEVPEATEEHAAANMSHLLTDCLNKKLKFVRAAQDDMGAGRFAFLVYCPWTRYHLVQMPGLPLNKVRFTNEEGQNVWHFPRLYIDGNSWLWKFVVDELNKPDAFTDPWNLKELEQK